MAYGLRATARKNLEDLMQQGIIKPVSSRTCPTPIVTSVKSNGQLHVCGDFRVTVNPSLRQTVEDMFESLQNSIIFSKLDLFNAFLQISLHDSSKELTTIHTSWSLFQYRYLLTIWT